MDDIAKYIDHTLLKKEASDEEIEKLCDEAIKYSFKAVVVFPEFLPIIVKKLKDKKPLPVTVIDFPLGNKSPDEKAFEAKKAIENGAKELDMVIDVIALKDKDYKQVFDGINKVVKAAQNIPIKVIIETCYLNPLEIAAACAIAKLAGAKFVKTSTGFAKAGAKVEDIIFMKNSVGDDFGVKASGGIKTYKDALLFLEAGATRIGTSSSVKIISKE